MQELSGASLPYRRVLLTGAAGGLGRVLRAPLASWAEVVRASDLAPLAPASAHEEVVQADLRDLDAVRALVAGVDAVVHLGGISLEAPFRDLVQANVIGLNHLYASAQKAGVRRIVYASSSHVVGFYERDQAVGLDAPLRPDCLYAVTKCFGEALSRYYFDRFGLETVCLRIGSSFPEPRDARMLVTYLAYEDLVELVRCALVAPRVGHTIVYGVSDNPVKWWSNAGAESLGFRPRASSAPFAARWPASPAPDPSDPTQRYQGGPWVLSGPLE